VERPAIAFSEPIHSQKRTRCKKVNPLSRTNFSTPSISITFRHPRFAGYYPLPAHNGIAFQTSIQRSIRMAGHEKFLVARFDLKQAFYLQLFES
jgi:hypothetical protein